MLQKAIGPKTRLPKTSKSTSSTQEDMEIEIAELLCGLMTSKNQESSQKPEPNDKLESNGAHSINRNSKTSIPSQNENSQNSVLPPPSNSPSPYLSSDVGELNIWIRCSLTFSYLIFCFFH